MGEEGEDDFNILNLRLKHNLLAESNQQLLTGNSSSPDFGTR